MWPSLLSSQNEKPPPLVIVQCELSRYGNWNELNDLIKAILILQTLG